MLDPVAILAALGVTEAGYVAPITGGWDTAIWRVTRASEVHALRVFRPEQAPVVRREVIAMRAAAASGVPVPTIQAEGIWQGRPALLLSWCPGRPLLHELRRRPWRAWPLGVAMGRAQAAIHAVPAPATLAGDAADWVGWAGPDEGSLQERLRAIASRPAVLLHLDYHPLNIMTDGTRVTGVLDWANTRAGDRRADLARTVTILRLMPPSTYRPLPAERVVRRLLEQGWRAGYRQAAGPIGNMAPFYAWAGAVMLRDLEPRVGRPDFGLEPHHLEPVHRWTAFWKRRAGIPA